MKHYDKLIFISRSDTSTGPMAAALMQNRYALADILIESRGTVVLFPEPVNAKAESVLADQGLGLRELSSRQLEETDFDTRTLMLTMEQSDKEQVLKNFPDAKNVFSLTEYVQAEADVPEPLGGTLEDYADCYQTLSELIDSLIKRLDAQELSGLRRNAAGPLQ